jgi:carboxylesterase type B
MLSTKMNRKVAVQFFIFFLFWCKSDANQPSIKLPEYTALGFQYVNENGFSTNLYLGLPYAKAPVGDLRFEKPRSLPLINDKVVNGTVFPPSCFQAEDMFHDGMSEDCLYLNVMTPSESENELLPVLIFIHGGGFSYGDTKFYGYETFIKNFVSQKIIMVTLQYRLAHFGFLATEDFEIAGNFGHFDQLAALQFIHRNIKAFGGDPARITLSGHSAGSLSTQALSFSPKAKGLFSQQIYMAGNLNIQWATSRQIFKHSEEISKAVGCGQSDTKERKACLKTVRYDEFWKARKNLNISSFRPTFVYDFLYWNPVYDNDFFGGKTYEELLPLQPKNNVMYGITSSEAQLWTLISGHPVTSVFSQYRGVTPEGRKNVSANIIKEVLEEFFTYKKVEDNVKESIINEIFEFYQISDYHVSANPLHYYEKWNDILSDILGSFSISKELYKQYEYGFKNQYIYVLNYTRPQDRHIVGNRAPHGYEHLYFSGPNAYNNDYDGIFSDEEKLLQKQYSELFITFVKTGKPSAAGISVPPVKGKEIPFIEFNPKVSIKKGYFEPMVEFWGKLFEKHEYDFILGKVLAKKIHDNKEL